MRLRVTGTPGDVNTACAIVKSSSSAVDQSLTVANSSVLCRCDSIEYNIEAREDRGYFTSLAEGYVTGARIWADGSWKDTSLKCVEANACYPRPCCANVEKLKPWCKCGINSPWRGFYSGSPYGPLWPSNVVLVPNTFCPRS